MADEDLLQRIQGLDDLDLAALLCLVSREHCIISTEPEALDDLVDELQLVASQTFNLKPAVVHCHPQTTLDDFAAAILLPSPAAANSRSSSPLRTRDSYFHGPGALRGPSLPGAGGGGGSNNSNNPAATTTTTHNHHHGQPQIANVIVARDLDKAPKAVQIQALELLRTRRIFTRTSVQTAPKQFLLVAVLESDGAGAGSAAKVTEHLNDFFYLAHWHDPGDGFARLDGEQARRDGGDGDDDGASVRSGQSGASVVRRSATPRQATAENARRSGGYGNEREAGGGGTPADRDVFFTEGDLAALATASRQAHVDVDVLRYQMNVVSFLRTHRAVAGGIAPVATQHYGQLVRCLAALHGLDYVTPSLVALAAKKIYAHRIRIVAPDKERSLQWGSDRAAVEQLLEGVGPEDVIEDVLAMVAAPL